MRGECHFLQSGRHFWQKNHIVRYAPTFAYIVLWQSLLWKLTPNRSHLKCPPSPFTLGCIHNPPLLGILIWWTYTSTIVFKWSRTNLNYKVNFRAVTLKAYVFYRTAVKWMLVYILYLPPQCTPKWLYGITPPHKFLSVWARRNLTKPTSKQNAAKYNSNTHWIAVPEERYNTIRFEHCTGMNTLAAISRN